MPLGSGRKVTYWLSMVLSIENEVLIPFIDPRGTKASCPRWKTLRFLSNA